MAARRVVSGAGVMLVGSLVACSPARAQNVGVLPGSSGAEPHVQRTPDAICPAPAKAAFSIEALHELVDVAMDFDLPEIIQLAEQTGWTGNHSSLGLSIAKTDCCVNIEVNSRNETACFEPIKVAVLVMLTDRRIEIAKDLVRDPGRLSVARHYYTLHAASTDAALTQFAKEVSPFLSRLILPNLQHDPAQADEDRERISQMMRTVIDQIWPSLSVGMRAASKGLDTPNEIAGLTQACQSAIGVAPRSQAGIKL